MIEVSLSFIERDVTKVLPKMCLHWDMRRTVGWFPCVVVCDCLCVYNVCAVTCCFVTQENLLRGKIFTFHFDVCYHFLEKTVMIPSSKLYFYV